MDNPVEAKCCREIEVFVTLLEKGVIKHPDLDSCFLDGYLAYLATFAVYPQAMK